MTQATTSLGAALFEVAGLDQTGMPSTGFYRFVPTTSTWTRLADRYDDKALIELLMVVGQYHLVSFFLNSAGVEREDGVPGLP